MIRINIDNKKDRIKLNHKKDFGLVNDPNQSYQSIKNSLNAFNHYLNFYGWFLNDSNTNFDIRKIERLLCSDTKAEIINVVNEIDNCIVQDAIDNHVTKESILKSIEIEFEQLFANFSNRNWAYEFLQIIDAKVCPYCNRGYTFTIKKKHKAELDHYFPKSMYPYMAVSIFNIVPCCSNCNKGKSKNYVNSNSQLIYYPYEEAFYDDIVFKTDFDEIDSWFDKNKKLSIALFGDTSRQEIIDTYNLAFKINDLYTQHDDYAREIIKKAMMFEDSFFESIFYSYTEMFDSPSEVKRTFYSNYYELDDIGKRPLSKLTRDLLNEFDSKL